jgi:N-acetylmuramoyl-L-alanine amidase
MLFEFGRRCGLTLIWAALLALGTGDVTAADVRVESLEPGGQIAQVILPTSSTIAQPQAVPQPPSIVRPQPVAVATTPILDRSRTRFVIGLEKNVEFQVFALSAPNRVIVEFPDVKTELPTLNGDKPVGLIKSFRAGLSAPGRTRVVIDVTGPVVVETATIERARDGKMPRLVLDIATVEAAQKSGAIKKAAALPAGQMSALGASGVQPPVPRPAMRPAQRAAGIYKPIIVIDPGHGGHDSGAKKFGAIEKDVVLAFSLKLRDKLNATGRYKVLMTRDTDTFVELDERRDFAERNKAALFIAVHADYAGSQARGATIYSLRDGQSKELMRSAKGEVTENLLSAKEIEGVKKAEGDVGAVRSILADLAQREVAVTKERTSFFARTVIDTMGATTNLQNNPDREASFRVLKTAKVPSVLIELAYVTNAQDAANLKSDAWRDKVSGSIVSAIENYFSHQVARLPM